MKQIFSLATDDWDLFVYGNEALLPVKQNQLKNMLAHRSLSMPLPEVQFSLPITIHKITTSIPFWNRYGIASCSSFLMPSPIFFENTHYDFEFIFKGDISLEEDKQPSIQHKLNKINDLFRLSIRNGLVLTGSVNFRNDIGWFKLPFSYWVNGEKKSISLSFEVLPLKMDMSTDLQLIYQALDIQYPLWRFSLAETAEQSLNRTRENHEPFELLWMAEFESLRSTIEKGFKQILNAPHSRLLPENKPLRADRIKGKINNKLAEKIKHGILSRQQNKRYAIPQKRLSVNTPENQFIKHVLLGLITKLVQFYKVTKESNQSPENHRLSDAFFRTIQDWITPLIAFQNNPLFKEISAFKGLNSESLVLQQKNGYSAVYKSWQQLKWYLGVLGNQATISMKTVEELYEIWCFLEIKRILVQELKFKEKTSQKGLLRKEGVEFKVQNGNSGAFKLERDDGITIELKHEPLFKNTSITEGIRVWTTSQKPDILLEATFPSGAQFIWLFDAKYRIKTDKGDSSNFDSMRIDYVPDDALNQMHRYRDALIYQESKDGILHKSRPIFGAYALYPGYFNQLISSNPYQEAINEIDIGAFPLLPSNSYATNIWLKDFLIKRLGQLTNHVKSGSADYVYAQSPSDKNYQTSSAQILPRGYKEN